MAALLAATAALVAYSLLAYGLMTHAPDRPWTVAALFGPLLLGTAAAGVQRRHWPTLAGCAALAALLALAVQRGGVEIKSLYVLQHAALHAVFGWSFGITLRPGATPLITAMGERVHRDFTPAMRAYTRRLTAAWALYFAAMIAVSLALYASVPWSWWSLYCNVLTPLAAVAVFVGEHLLRRWRHPEFEAVSLHRAWRAFRT